MKSTQVFTARKLRAIALCFVAAGATLGVAIQDAAAARGGGGRSGGGGKMAQSSVSGANRSMSGSHTGGSSANRANTGNVNTGSAGNRANTGNVNTGNNGNRVNNGNINTGNVNIGNDVNIDIDGGYGHGWHGGYYHPIAAGVAIGAIAVTTAAVVGSYYHTLPVGCSTVIKSGVSYSYCGSVYYQQTWSGNDVVYVVVSP